MNFSFSVHLATSVRFISSVDDSFGLGLICENGLFLSAREEFEINLLLKKPAHATPPSAQANAFLYHPTRGQAPVFGRGVI